MQENSSVEKYDYIFKIVIIGNGSCGKSTNVQALCKRKGKKNMSQTVGVEFASKLVTIQNKSIKLQLWDTAGQERFKSVARTYYRGALGAIVVFDITSPETFSSVGQWIKDAKDFGRSDISIVIVGNKTDLSDQRRVNNAQAQLGSGVQYFETSAITGQNVDEVFHSLAANLLQRIESGQIDKEDLRPRLISPASRATKLTPNLKEDDSQDKKQQCGYC